MSNPSKSKALASVNVKPDELNAKGLANLLRINFVTESSALSSSIKKKRKLKGRESLARAQVSVKIKSYDVPINILYVIKKYRLFNLHIKQPMVR